LYLQCLLMTLSDKFLFFPLKKTIVLLTVCFIFISNISFANNQLKVVVGLAKPPYVIQENDKGFELDLIRNILKKMGKSVKFVYTQFGHSSKMIDVKNIDAVMTTNQNVFRDDSKLTNEYITYQNVAISLTENNFKISKINDLAGHSISSFQKADKILGAEFANILDRTLFHIKVADQSHQPSQLLKKRVDVLIMDINIFKYFVNKLGIKDIDSTFTIHEIFPSTHYRMAFKNKAYVKAFNESLAQYKQTNEYQLLKSIYNL
jgi:polar amino acid transport system substrate-binding protein